jgi:hypothetical protein
MTDADRLTRGAAEIGLGGEPAVGGDGVFHRRRHGHHQGVLIVEAAEETDFGKRAVDGLLRHKRDVVQHPLYGILKHRSPREGVRSNVGTSEGGHSHGVTLSLEGGQFQL